jgi:hypothetical protein
MSISTTTTKALEAVFIAQIIATTPRIQVHGAETWKPHEKATGAASRTRNFRLVFEPQGYVYGGTINTTSMGTAEVLLRVRADYAATHAENLHLITADWFQLADRLQELAHTDSNGLISVRTSPRGIEPVGANPRDPANRDVAQFDLTYQVRYLITRG